MPAGFSCAGGKFGRPFYRPNNPRPCTGHPVRLFCGCCNQLVTNCRPVEFACACELLGKGEIAPLAKHGVNQHSKDSTGGDNITSSKRGTDTECTITSRLTWKSLFHFQPAASGCMDAVASGVWCQLSPKHHRQKLLIQAFKTGVATPATMCFRSFSGLFQNTKTA